MALPNQLKTARMDDSTIGSTIDDHMGDAEQAVADILGSVIDTNIAAAAFEITADGLEKVILQDLGSDPAAEGVLARNGAHLRFHDGTAARELRRSFKKITASAIINGTTDETDIVAAEEIPADTLGTNGCLKITLLCKVTIAVGAGTTLTVRLKYGATTVATITIAWTSGVGETPLKIEAYLCGDGATNTQAGWLEVRGDHSDISGTNLVRMAHANGIAEDSTQAKNLVITGQWDTVDDVFELIYGTIEKI